MAPKESDAPIESLTSDQSRPSPAESTPAETEPSAASIEVEPATLPVPPREVDDDAPAQPAPRKTEVADLEPQPIGTPRSGATGTHRVREPAGRGRLVGWAAVAIVALGLAGWGGWTLLGPEDPGTDELTEAANDSTATTLASTSVATTSISTSTTTLDLAQCQTLADAHAEAAIAWVIGLRAENLTAPDAFSPSSTVDELAELGCDEAEASSRYRQTIEERATGSGGMTWLGLAAAHLAGLERDPAELLSGASASYPEQGIYEPSDEPERLPSWIVIFESLEVGDYTQAEADSRAQSYRNLGMDIGVLLSSDYGSLNAGYWVVFARGYATSEEAGAACAGVRNGVDFCYSRYLSQLPLTTGVYAGCGEFGRFSARADIDVHTQPNRNQTVLTSVSAGDVLYAAGIPESADGTSWIPVAVLNGVGWAIVADLEADPGCAAAPIRPVPDSCDAVAEEAAELLRVVAADPSFAEADRDAQHLVARAAALSCDPIAMNTAISEGVWPEPGLTDESLRLAVFAFRTFLADA